MLLLCSHAGLVRLCNLHVSSEFFCKTRGSAHVKLNPFCGKLRDKSLEKSGEAGSFDSCLLKSEFRVGAELLALIHFEPSAARLKIAAHNHTCGNQISIANFPVSSDTTNSPRTPIHLRTIWQVESPSGMSM